MSRPPADRILLATGRDGTTVVLVKHIKEREEQELFGRLPDTWHAANS